MDIFSVMDASLFARRQKVANEVSSPLGRGGCHNI